MNCRIIFAEDQQLIRESVRVLLDGDPDLSILDTAANGSEALSLCRERRPDIVLMDVRMPVMDGLEAARRMREEGLDIKIVLLTTFPDAQMVSEAIGLSVDGFLLKDVEPQVFVQAIRAIASGLVVFQDALKPQLAAGRISRSGPGPLDLGLTAKDLDYIRHIVDGLGNKEIAFREGCSEGTVKNRVSAILAKLGLDARTQVAVYAIKHGLIGELD